MSFICESCKRATKAHESCVIRVVADRQRVYTHIKTRMVGDQKIEKKMETLGSEIVREEKWCHPCYNKDFRAAQQDLAKKVGGRIEPNGAIVFPVTLPSGVRLK